MFEADRLTYDEGTFENASGNMLVADSIFGPKSANAMTFPVELGTWTAYIDWDGSVPGAFAAFKDGYWTDNTEALPAGYIGVDSGSVAIWDASQWDVTEMLTDNITYSLASPAHSFISQAGAMCRSFRDGAFDVTCYRSNGSVIVGFAIDMH